MWLLNLVSSVKDQSKVSFLVSITTDQCHVTRLCMKRYNVYDSNHFWIPSDENQELASFIESMARSFPDDEFVNKYVESPMMQKILDSYELFINDMSSKSRTFAFWSMYIKMTGSYCII